MKKGEPQYGKRKLVCGVGVFDADYSKLKDERTKKAYRDWNNMLQRCYGKSNFPSKPAYKECVVCEEWHSFLKFREWFDENYIEGYVLDKDIRYAGNKMYSPQTCCYIPPFINTLLLSSRSSRGKYPIGVIKNRNGFMARLCKRGKLCYIGSYYTIEEAFVAYKHERELYIKEIAQEYYDEGLINIDIYNSLINYEVKTTD
jgi:hypothetical protein